MLFFLIGVPGESHKTIYETEKLLEEIKPNYVSCSVLVPFPGTYFYKWAENRNYVSSHFNWSKVSYSRAYFPTDYMSKKEINKKYKYILLRISQTIGNKKLKFCELFYNFKVIIKRLNLLEIIDFFVFNFIRIIRWKL